MGGFKTWEKSGKGAAMSEVERRAAKLSKQSEVDEAEPTIPPDPHNVVTVVTKPAGGVSTPTVLSASSSETSPDEAPAKPPNTRKQTLIRTQALEGTSPPPDSFLSQLHSNGSPTSPETTITAPPLSNGAPSGGLASQRGSGASYEAKEFLRSSHKMAISNDSGRGTFEITDPVAETTLSRASSTDTNSTASTVVLQQAGAIDKEQFYKDVSSTDEDSTYKDDACVVEKENLYKDASGIDLGEFFKQTLMKSPKDKKTLFFLERELQNFVRDESVRTKKLHEMNPYDRMLVHRLAAHMGIEHNVDQTGKSVIVAKTDYTRIPEPSLVDYLREIEHGSHEKKRILLKKPASLDEKQTRGIGKTQLGDTRAKSLEERQQVYIRIRERIFAKPESLDGSQPQTSTPTLLTASYSPSMMQHQGSVDGLRAPSLAQAKTSHLFKSADSATRTTDSRSHGGSRQRGGMTKSNSYAGSVSPHTTLPGPPVPMAAAACPQALVNTAPPTESRAVPESTAYGTPPPLLATSNPGDTTTMTPVVPPERSVNSPQTPQAGCPTSYAYLVSSDYTSIPVGSLIIDPHTMQPHVNADGSMYRFDPSHPPPFMAVSHSPAPVNPATPPAPTMMYPVENNVNALSGQFGRASISGMEVVSEACPVGQMGPTGVPMLPHMMSQVYTGPTQATQFPQGQYLSTSPAPQHAVRIVAINPQGGAAAPVDSQGQTTVPMPAVQAYAPVQLFSAPQPYQHHMVAAGPQEEVLAGAAYGQLAPETMALNGAGPLMHGYSLAQAYPAPGLTAGQFTHHPGPGPQAYAPVVSSTPTTYYAIPPSTPTPPPLLNQPPPMPPVAVTHQHHSHQGAPHHQQQQQQQQQHQQQQQQQQQQQHHHQVPSHGVPAAHHPHHHHHHPHLPQHHQASVPAGGPHIYGLLHNPAAGPTVTFPHPPAPAPSSSPSVKSWATLHPHYRPASPPQPQQQVTINYVGPPPTPPQAGSQLVAVPTAGFPQRTLIQLGTTQNFQGQPYIYHRPFTPLQGGPALRPHLPSLQLTGPTHGPQGQARPKVNGAGGKSKKGSGKKSTAGAAEEESSGATVTLVAPLIPGLTGASTQTYIPPATSNRQ
ncbi:cAMP-regulated phosphoprotein 21 isoform X1 [Aplysia californica]|uniref:cAMP-regulated phosphoprotein 21 isoform X1 n=2 Tax=Aplysia californica TaxID=6500 RepID=A0ABM0JSR9_APLCA|nr:cAMP-regulated phosphoprotein 21 isoform X1 [Aplysia californica]